MEAEKVQVRVLVLAACCLTFISTAFCLQGCFLAGAPLLAETETAGSDVAPTGAWNLVKSLAGGPSPMELENTRLQVEARQQELKTNAEEKQRSESERAATIGVLRDLWNWQHDPAIGDLLIYVKAGGDPGVAMQAAVQRTHWETWSAAAGRARQEAKPLAQSSAMSRQRGTD
jgi:hypothetical protein